MPARRRPTAAPPATCSPPSTRCRSCTAWRGRTTRPVDRLAESLGITPRHRFYSGIGGTTPQVLVDDAADVDPQRRDGPGRDHRRRSARHEAPRQEGRRTRWRGASKPRTRRRSRSRRRSIPAEIAHNVFQAWLTFPIFDVARRARLGIYARRLRARRSASCSRRSARSPRRTRTRGSRSRAQRGGAVDADAEQPPRRLPVHEVRGVDHGRRHGRDGRSSRQPRQGRRTRRARRHGACTCAGGVTRPTRSTWPSTPTCRASPAMKAASDEALRVAGVVDRRRRAHRPVLVLRQSSVNLACDALGIDGDDPRGLTVTGGLPFSRRRGQQLHAALDRHDGRRAARRRRARSASSAASGMHMTKHVLRRVFDDAGRRSPCRPTASVQAAVRRDAPARAHHRHVQPAARAIATLHRRPRPRRRARVGPGDRRPGRRVARLRQGRRRRGLMREMEATEWVGETVEFVAGGRRRQPGEGLKESRGSSRSSHRRRRPHRVRQAQGRAGRVAPDRPARLHAQEPGRRDRRRPRAHRRRRHRLRHAVAASRAATSGATRWSPAACRGPRRPRRSTGSAARRSRRCTSSPRRSCRACTTSRSPAASSR